MREHCITRVAFQSGELVLSADRVQGENRPGLCWLGTVVLPDVDSHPRPAEPVRSESRTVGSVTKQAPRQQTPRYRATDALGVQRWSSSGEIDCSSRYSSGAGHRVSSSAEKASINCLARTPFCHRMNEELAATLLDECVSA